MEYTIRLVSTDEDRFAVYRFRYEIYVKEMGRKQVYADHDRRLVEDPLDWATSRLFVAREAKTNAIIGTVRTNYLRDGSVGGYEAHYRLPESPNLRSSISMTTRLMIEPRYRRTRLAIALAEATYAQALQDGIREDFIDCNSHLLSFFDRLGYRFSHSVEHPEYGMVDVMNLQFHDRSHFEAKRSPFLAILDRSLSDASGFGLAS